MITLPSGRTIGPGQPPYIIAEIGSNWRTLDDSTHSIAMAKRAGADAVKFQAFDQDALYGIEYGTEIAGQTISSRSDAGQWLIHRLPLDWLPLLADKARAVGIDFLCSAFSPELVRAVDPFVAMHKVASAELSHLRILEAVRGTGKPVILSTGASGPEDIHQALKVLHGDPEIETTQGGWPACQVAVLYCVAAYPARDIDFRHMDHFRDLFNVPIGFSDHTTDYNVIPRLAVEKGACVIEKHMTAIEGDTPDRPHSLTVDEFKKMVQSIQGTRPFAWGSGEEKEMQLRHNRRLIATREIQAGAVFSEVGEAANFGSYRSLTDDTRGLSGFAINAVHDKRATRTIQAGEAIGPGDFE